MIVHSVCFVHNYLQQSLTHSPMVILADSETDVKSVSEKCWVATQFVLLRSVFHTGLIFFRQWLIQSFISAHERHILLTFLKICSDRRNSVSFRTRCIILFFDPMQFYSLLLTLRFLARKYKGRESQHNLSALLIGVEL